MKTAVAFAFCMTLLCTDASASPLRRLEYAFANYLTSHARTHDAQGFSGPQTGVLYVDLLQNAADGGVLVQAKEWWWQEVRPTQAATCDLHASGDLTCDQYPLISTTEFILLPMLGRDYFSGIAASPAAALTYSIVVPENYYSTAWSVDLNVLRRSGPIAQIDAKGAARLVHGPLDKQGLEASIVYDRSKSLPIEVDADLTASSLNGVDEPQTVDLKLLRDSGA
jgi:hypothetical protein